MFNEVVVNHRVLPKYLLLSLFSVLFFFTCFSTIANADTFECSGALYPENMFSESTEKFSVFDKVYLKITCKGLLPGNYNITSNWINPLGEVKRQNNHSFELQNDSGYMSYSWFKLLRRGPLTRTITGQDFSFKAYGQWTVTAYMNGKEIVSKEFTMD